MPVIYKANDPSRLEMIFLFKSKKKREKEKKTIMKPSPGLAPIKADVKQIYDGAPLGFYVRLSFRGGHIHLQGSRSE